MALSRVAVRVPATSANLGPGFDALGVALSIFNTVTLERASAFGIAIEGEGADRLSRGPENLVFRGVAAAFAACRQELPQLHLHCENAIPLARGLGSSAAAVVAGLVAGNALLGEPLSQDRLLDLALEMEGHPDNVTPALLGGCRVVVSSEEGLVSAPVPFPPELRAILFVPDFEMPTQQSRRLLVPEVSRQDAVFNLGRSALLVAALATGRLDLLRVATQDRLHQPARQQLFPAMPKLFQAAVEAGAWGAFLSGSGPTILALATQGEEAIARAMAEVAHREDITGRTWVTQPTDVGAEVVARS